MLFWFAAMMMMIMIMSSFFGQIFGDAGLFFVARSPAPAMLDREELAAKLFVACDQYYGIDK